MTRIKKMAALLLVMVLGAAAIRAEERLIPFDDFLISADLNGPPERESKKLRVSVQVRRMAEDPKLLASIHVDCPELRPWFSLLEPVDTAALVAAGTAALKGLDYRQECDVRMPKSIYEVVTVEGGKRVRMRPGGAPPYSAKEADKLKEVLFTPEEAVRLKETLAEAAAAQAWYKMLLTARSMPAQTAAAHPPQASGYCLISKVGVVCGDIRKEGLCYEATVYHFNTDQKRQHEVWHGLQFHYYGDHRWNALNYGEHTDSTARSWIKPMMDQVALALEAVAKQQAFIFESPPGFMGAFGASNDTTHKFTMTANLATQQADVKFIPGYPCGLMGGTHAGGSFDVAQLAAIRELNAEVVAREQWCAEHEGWFFDGLMGEIKKQ